MEKGLSLYVHNGSAAGGGVWRQKKVQFDQENHLLRCLQSVCAHIQQFA